MIEVIIRALGIYLVFSFIHYAAKKKKPFKRAFISIFAGILSLAIVDLLSGLTGVYVPITALSLFISAAGGIPGTALMVLLTIF